MPFAWPGGFPGPWLSLPSPVGCIQSMPRALPVQASRQNTLLPSAWTTVLQSISPELSQWVSVGQPLAEDPSQGSPGCGLTMSIHLFACMCAHPASTHPCAFSLPFALACMTGKIGYKQMKIETQKRANYNMFNYLFRNHSSSLLYSVPGNVSFVIWQGHFFFLTSFSPSLGWQGGYRVRTWGEVM